MLHRAYDRKSWHGTNLRGSIRGLTPRLAAWRPAAGRHNIWELVVHAAYWKYVARRRLSGDQVRSFPLQGSNFWRRPGIRGVRLPPSRATRRPIALRRTAEALAEAGQADRLQADIALLGEMHQLLLETVSAIPASRLHHRLGKGQETRFGLIAGVAAHDLYHAGQIQLIKALSQKR